jgi:FAD/FMN-containing dehydrogenase
LSSREQLIKIVGIDNVFDSQEAIESYSRDHSFVAPLKPWFVVRPKNVEEVQGIVKWANETSTPLVPVSSGPPVFMVIPSRAQQGQSL